jgi:hypothetical protein
VRRPGIIPNHACKHAVLNRPSSCRPAERSRSEAGLSSKLKFVSCGISCGCCNGSCADRGGVPAIGWSWRRSSNGSPRGAGRHYCPAQKRSCASSRARAPQLGRLRQAPTPSAAGDGLRGRRPDPQVGPRKPEVGISLDPGRAAQAGTPMFSRVSSPALLARLLPAWAAGSR